MSPLKLDSLKYPNDSASVSRTDPFNPRMKFEITKVIGAKLWTILDTVCAMPVSQN
jgi:hypothetical protein